MRKITPDHQGNKRGQYLFTPVPLDDDRSLIVGGHCFRAYLAFLGIWLIISSRRASGSTGQGGAQLSRRFALIRKAQSRKDQDQG